MGVLGDLCLTVAALLLLFVVWQLWWTDVTATRVQQDTVAELRHEFDRPGSVRPRPVAFGGAFAILRIPRLGSNYARPVLEGTDTQTLDRGVGHYAGTTDPGAIGNFAVAGHRTTYGRPFHDIDRLRPGDKLIVETRAGYSVYVVRRHTIVPPTDVSVIDPVPERPGAQPTHAWMTMTSCHPKYSAQQRYVVFAELAGTYSRAQGLPRNTLTVPTGA
jgi:sortase A